MSGPRKDALAGRRPFRSYERGSTRVLEVAGDLDLSNADALRAAIAAAIDVVDPLVLDLSEVNYLDSSALSVLVKQRNVFGLRLQIVAPRNASVRRIFEITGLSKRLALKDSLEGVLTLVGSATKGSETALS